jgi:hypothetical protein
MILNTFHGWTENVIIFLTKILAFDIKLIIKSYGLNLELDWTTTVKPVYNKL